jgi:minor curlin subunit
MSKIPHFDMSNGPWVLLVGLVFVSQHGAAQDFGPNSDLQDSELSLSLSTTVNFDGALGGSITIGQYGLYNTTNIIQAGSDTNTIEVIQQGNNNRAEVLQFGIDNEVNLLQIGENNLFTILQDGNGNTANVNQLGEQTFTVTQIGNEMVVNITQFNQQ